MSRLDEMIYSLHNQSKLYSSNPLLFDEQEIMGKQRMCCRMCGHCPDAEAELLREIREDLRANTTLKSKLAPKVESKGQED